MQKFIFLSNHNFSLSLPFTVSIEVLSSLQIIYLIIKLIVTSAEDHQFTFFGFTWPIPFATEIFNAKESEKSDGHMYLLLGICTIYLAASMLQSIAIFIMTRSGVPKNNKIFGLLSRVMSFVYHLHSRILFLPIQIFLLRLLKQMFLKAERNFEEVVEDDDEGKDDEGPQIDPLLVITIIFSAVNFVLALIKESFLYQIHQKNFYSAKTNLYQQTIFIYKTIVIMLDHFSVTTVPLPTLSITHLTFTLVLMYVLYKILPFYDFKLLKTAVIMTSLMLSFSLTSIIQVFTTDIQLFYASLIILSIVPGLLAKLALRLFRYRFENIIRGRITSSAHAIHFALLFNEFKKETDIDRNFFPSREFTLGVLKMADIKNLPNLWDQKNIKEFKQELYLYIVNRLEIFLLRNPKSQNLMIFMAEIYLKKLKNPHKAIELVRRVESQKHSVWIESSLEDFYLDLKKLQTEKILSLESQMHVDNYFKSLCIGNSLKRNILLEVECHLVFWNLIQKNGFDVKKIVEKVEEIDRHFIEISKQFEIYLEDFRRSVSFLILMYAVYLNNLRQLPDQAQTIIRKYQTSNLNSTNCNEISDLSTGKTAIIIVSLDKQNVGDILAASASVKSVFGQEKSDLVKKRFDCLFPSTVGKNFQNFLQSYSRNLDFNLDYKTKSYGKTLTGDLFEIEVHFQFYLYLDKNITLMILIKKISEPEIILIANSEGSFVDQSRKLIENLKDYGMDLSNLKRMQDISREFEQINAAFNYLYRAQKVSDIEIENRKKTHPIESIQSFPDIFDLHTDCNLFIQENRNPKKSVESNVTKLATQKDLLSFHTLSKPEQSFHGNYFTIEEAVKICSMYNMGHLVAFNLAPSNKAKPSIKLQAYMKIRLCYLGGQIHKVIKLTKLAKEKMPLILDSKISQALEPNLLTEIGYFSSTTERKLISQPETLGKYPKNQSVKKEDAKILITIKDENDTEMSYDRRIAFAGSKNSAKRIDHDDQRSSMAGMKSKENKVAKTLRDIYERRKMNPLMHSIIYVLYFAILSIISLAGINFYLARSSISEIEKGVKIVHIATQRLQDMISMWQVGLFIYAVEIDLQEYPAERVEIFQEQLKTYCLDATSNNNVLKDELSLVRDTKFLQEGFHKEINMWIPSDWEGDEYDQVNTFIANDMLVNEYSKIANFVDLEHFTEPEQSIYAFNNTANDYMIYSKEIISTTEELLQSIVDDNIAMLNIIFTIEISVVGVLWIALIVLCFMNTRSYKRLFKALVRIQKRNTSQRIDEITKLSVFFEKDVESTSFSHNASNFLEGSNNAKRRGRLQINSKDLDSSKDFTMKDMNLYSLKILILGSLFIPLFIMFFVMSLSQAMLVFESFENISKQVSILSQASYQGDLALNTFISTITFYNHSTILLFNQPPEEQIIDILEKLKEMNEQLTSVVLKEEEGYFEPIIERILKNDVCEYLDSDLEEDCEVATHGGNIGLLSVNNHYIQTLTNSINSFAQNTTFDNGKICLETFMELAGADLIVTKASYSFMVNHILSVFEHEVGEDMTDAISLFLGVCGVVLVYMIYMQAACLSKVKKIDHNRRKVLNIIPYNLIQETRALSYYLVTDFKKEIEGVRNIL